MNDRGHLGDLGRKIIEVIGQPYSVGGERAVIGASLGIAIAPYDGVTPDDLVASAQMALDAARGGGRGQYRFFAHDLVGGANQERVIGRELALALANDHLEMHYQPVLRAADYSVVSFEGFIRWNHGELGWISPGDFIPIAERTNLINRIGAWTLKRACRDAAKWPRGIGVSVNISARQFFSGSLPSIVAAALQDSGLRPDRLELEITESVFLGDGAVVDQVFAALRALGVRLALDDFGTGYSSLGTLRRAPFQRIKIDQSFVRDCCERGSSNAAIITALVSLAGALDMETTAEGVEAMEELQLVRNRGVSHIQGFIFSRAVPQDILLARLAAGDFVYEPCGPERPRSERRTVLRRIGVIHQNHRYEAVLRNLSRTGAMIEGILDVPIGTDLVLDLGAGQLAVATVRRSQDATQGVQFEVPLIDDGAGGLCTRHRISPYQLAAAGLPLASLQDGTLTRLAARSPTARRFMQVDITTGSHRAA